jgi:ribosome-binding ATPase YchF (GTP1/OBG family)
MRVGIFGNTGAGKSTLFRALAGAGETTAKGLSSGVCTIRVPDDRVDRLSDVYRPKKTTHISLTFEDIDSKEGELLPPDALTRIKGVDVLAIVLRGFSDDFHPAPPGGLDPVREFRAIESGLTLSDYLIAQKRVERMVKEARRDAEWTTLQRRWPPWRGRFRCAGSVFPGRKRAFSRDSGSSAAPPCSSC